MQGAVYRSDSYTRNVDEAKKIHDRVLQSRNPTRLDDVPPRSGQSRSFNVPPPVQERQWAQDQHHGQLQPTDMHGDPYAYSQHEQQQQQQQSYVPHPSEFIPNQPQQGYPSYPPPQYPPESQAYGSTQEAYFHQETAFPPQQPPQGLVLPTQPPMATQVYIPVAVPMQAPPQIPIQIPMQAGFPGFPGFSSVPMQVPIQTSIIEQQQQQQQQQMPQYQLQLPNTQNRLISNISVAPQPALIPVARVASLRESFANPVVLSVPSQVGQSFVPNPQVPSLQVAQETLSSASVRDLPRAASFRASDPSIARSASLRTNLGIAIRVNPSTGQPQAASENLVPAQSGIPGAWLPSASASTQPFKSTSVSFSESLSPVTEGNTTSFVAQSDAASSGRSRSVSIQRIFPAPETDSIQASNLAEKTANGVLPSDNPYVKYGPLLYETARKVGELPPKAPVAPPPPAPTPMRVERSYQKPDSRQGSYISRRSTERSRSVDPGSYRDRVGSHAYGSYMHDGLGTGAPKPYGEPTGSRYLDSKFESRADDIPTYDSYRKPAPLPDTTSESLPRTLSVSFVGSDHPYADSEFRSLRNIPHEYPPSPSRNSEVGSMRRASYISENPKDVAESVAEDISVILQRGGQQLNLRFKGLYSIPVEVFSMRYLQVLNLSKNQLEELPPQINALQSLIALDLSSNRISDLPPTIGDLTNLQELSLSENGIMFLPRDIGRLKRLCVFSAAANKLNEMPSDVYQLRSLVTLDLNGNDIRAISPSVSQLTNLTSLNLSGNQLSTLPSELAYLPVLRELNVSVNSLSYLPDDIGRCTTLEALIVSVNMCQYLPPSIGNLSNLAELRVESNRLVELPRELGYLTNLRKLTCSGNPIQNPPQEVCRRGKAAIIKYLREVI